MTKEKLLHDYKMQPNNKTNPHKRRLPRMTNDQWLRLCNIFSDNGTIAPTKPNSETKQNSIPQ